MKADARTFVCTNQKSGVGDDVAKALKKELKVQGLKKHSRVQACNCLDLCKNCKKGPGAALIMHPDGTVYGNVRPADAAEIVEKYLGRGSVVARLQLNK
jgi:(2Fe-2S) ferredoxin